MSKDGIFFSHFLQMLANFCLLFPHAMCFSVPLSQFFVKCEPISLVFAAIVPHLQQYKKWLFIVLTFHMTNFFFLVRFTSYFVPAKITMHILTLALNMNMIMRFSFGKNTLQNKLFYYAMNQLCLFLLGFNCLVWSGLFSN